MPLHPSYVTRAARALLVLVVAASLLALAAPAQAVPDAPQGLTASGQPIPTLSWTRVATAMRYRVQGSEDPSFPANNLVFNTETTNDRFTPARVLRSGPLYWQVQAIDSTGSSAWTRSETTIAPHQVPGDVQVSTAQSVLPPVAPPVISWQPVAGAIGYDVEMDADDDGVGSTVRQDIRTTTYVWPEPQGVGEVSGSEDFFVRVRAKFENNLQSAWSGWTSYDVTQLPPVTSAACAAGLVCAPRASDGQVRASVTVQDVTFDWDPIKGAKQYEIWTALDQDFNTQIEKRTVYSTRYSPSISSTTVPYDNNTYYWKVRAINAAGQPTPWPSTPSVFQRRWSASPTLVYPPVGGTPVSGDVYFQWTPVRHATRYVLDVGNDENFTTGTYASCTTAMTTFVPGDDKRSTCNPSQSGNVYWRVRALDQPRNPAINGVYSETGRFVFDSGRIQVLAPPANSTVEVPTIRWEPSQDANRYFVRVEGSRGTVTATTSSTSWTPTELLPSESDTEDPQRLPDRFNFWISAIDGDNKSSTLYDSGSFSVTESITASPAPLTPLPAASNQVASRFPALAWQPYASSEGSRVQYQLEISETPGVIVSEGATPILSKRLAYPAVTDLETYFLRAGTYRWRAVAIDPQTGNPFDTGPWGQFTISAPASVDGERAALDGLAIDQGNACTRQLVVGNESTVCTGMSATPVLDWDAVRGAGGYQVYVSDDPDFTNLLVDGVQTINSRFALHDGHVRQQLPDNESGPAYFWYVRPCTQVMPARNCGPGPSGTVDAGRGAFRKVSPRIRLQSPSDGATLADQLTFSWEDYAITNAGTAPQYGGTRAPYQTARGYRIQVAQSATITDANAIDDQTVEQATYTAHARTYPEGELWWRVQAIDAAGNRLAWSETRRVIKGTPATNLDPATSAAAERPAVDAGAVPAFNSRQATGPTLFRWTAENFDSLWDIEVYRNDDTTLSSANRIISTQVKQAAFVLPSALPPSSSAYRWRIRRTDVAGQPGRWSDLGRFFVEGRAVALSSPTEGGVVKPNAVHLAWEPYAAGGPQATRYISTLENMSGGNSPGSVTTSATAVSVATNLTSGTYAWTVRAYDSQGNLLGSSTERRFTVDAGLRAVSPVRIDAPTGSAVGQTLTSTAPVWSEPDVQVSYQWLRGGQPISNATGPTYVLTTADYTRVVSLRVTGRKAAYTDAITTSNEFSITAGGAVQNAGAPVVTGSALVGGSLSVSNGAWNPAANKFRYQWLRQGVPVTGATSSSYRVTADDAGRDLSVTVFGSATGFEEGAATTAAVSVARMKATVTGTLKKDRVKVKKVATLSVTVAVPGQTTPQGVVQVLDKGKKVAQVTMAPVHKGVVTIKLKKLKKGKHPLQVVYLGNGQVFGSKSKKLTLYVVK